MGLYSTYADSMTVPYMEIGETGQRTDVKWATLTNEKTGKGLMIVGNPRMEFSAQHYTPEQLSDVKLPWELKRDKDITLRVDLHQMGLGGINTWGAEPMPAYRLNANREYSHTFRIAPIRKQLNDPTEYSLLGFRNFGWNKEIAPAKYGSDEIEKIYKNDEGKEDITKNSKDSTERRTVLPGKMDFISSAEKDYNVFDAQGKKIGAFTTRGVEDLHALTRGLVKNSGVYVVKAQNGGQAFRITVKK
jgi:beta-galactosidase